MSLLDEWIEKKRKRELERINKEIEELRRLGPDFRRQPADSPSHHSSPHQSSPKDSSLRGTCLMGMIVLLVLLVVVVIFYQTQISDLKYEYTTTNVTMGEEVVLLRSRLNETESKLALKELLEQNLSTESLDLKQDIIDLKNQVFEFNKTLLIKEDEKNDMAEQLKNVQDELKLLKVCVNNDSITDKEDCLIL